MATQYKVKKGDTLSKIASTYGVGVNDIQGYRSGNKDLIYEGETLTIGGKAAAPKSDYSTAVKEELDDGTEESGYNSKSWEADYNNAKKERESAYKKLKGIATDTFNSEYDSRKLDKKKKRISTLDSDIAAAKSARDAAIDEVRRNPGLSASQMTGDIAKIRDNQNNVINNLISERNSVASEYNTELDEIDSIVGRATKDAELDYTYWGGLMTEAGSKLSEYDKALKAELEAELEQDNFERSLAQQLQIAQMRSANSGGGGGSSDSWSLVYDDFGKPKYWYNKKTKEIDYNVGGGAPDGEEDGGADVVSYDNLEDDTADDGGWSFSTSKWNPLNWF